MKCKELNSKTTVTAEVEANGLICDEYKVSTQESDFTCWIIAPDNAVITVACEIYRPASDWQVELIIDGVVRECKTLYAKTIRSKKVVFQTSYGRTAPSVLIEGAMKFDPVDEGNEEKSSESHSPLVGAIEIVLYRLSSERYTSSPIRPLITDKMLMKPQLPQETYMPLKSTHRVQIFNSTQKTPENRLTIKKRLEKQRHGAIRWASFKFLYRAEDVLKDAGILGQPSVPSIEFYPAVYHAEEKKRKEALAIEEEEEEDTESGQVTPEPANAPIIPAPNEFAKSDTSANMGQNNRGTSNARSSSNPLLESINSKPASAPFDNSSPVSSPPLIRTPNEINQSSIPQSHEYPQAISSNPSLFNANTTPSDPSMGPPHFLPLSNIYGSINSNSRVERPQQEFRSLNSHPQIKKEDEPRLPTPSKRPFSEINDPLVTPPPSSTSTRSPTPTNTSVMKRAKWKQELAAAIRKNKEADERYEAKVREKIAQFNQQTEETEEQTRSLDQLGATDDPSG
ncbi:MAG: hypothetical protein M1833_001764 [Piccolia ochrophora]|nr:MAG: hypothetical protein M1833_001764 [Piccolia ochrophora]